MNNMPTVLFDLGNVLVKVDKEKALKVFAGELNATRESLLDFPASKIEIDFETGKIDTAEYIKGVQDYFNLDGSISYEFLVEVWKKPFTIMEDSIRILDQVRVQTGVALLSNTNPLHIDAVYAKYPRLLKRFDNKIFSFTAGTNKPNPEIYEFALDEIGIEPQNALFIDDLEENVRAAEDIGINAHQYKDSERLADFLRKQGFTIEL